MQIYLAGSVPKGHEEEQTFVNWRFRYKDTLEKLFDAHFIFPNSGDMDENDFLLIVGKDSKSIKESDLIVINAEEKLGPGTAMEMVIAKYFAKATITVMPNNSHHRRANMLFKDTYLVEDWMHPFIHTFSDFIVEKVEDIAQVKNLLTSVPIKDISIINAAIEHQESYIPNENA